MFAQAAELASATLPAWIQLIVQAGSLGLLAIIVYKAPSWLDKILDKAAEERDGIHIRNTNERQLDRTASRERDAQVISAINDQTRKIEAALKESCKYRP